MKTQMKSWIVASGLALAASSAFGQRLEENGPGLTYNGTWTPTNDGGASGGAYTVSSTVGSTITFNITGGNFVLYRKVDPNGGYASVAVDGKDFGRITFYFQEARWQVPAAVDQMGNGQHTIVLTVIADKPAASGGNNVYFDALETPIPTTLSGTQAQTDAIARTNFYRTLIGLPPARHHATLCLSASAHARYLSDVDFVGNGSDPHVETFGASPNFSGVQPSDRAALFGFPGAGVAENANNTPDPNTFVDEWMDGVYHRQPYISYSLTEVGFGAAPKGSAMNFAGSAVRPVRPAGVFIATFPADNQTDVWLNYGGGDGPSNLRAGGSYGYPISLVVNYPDNATPGTAAKAPTTGTLTDAAGNNIPVTLADSSTDGRLGGFWMIPNQPLIVSTTYTARMTGTDALNNPFDKTWKFTTSNANSVHSVRPVLGRNSYIYSINWEMPGNAVASQLEYGPTTAYGTVIPGELFPGRQTTFRALVPGLMTTPVTNYRVTSKDAQGNFYASPNHTITADTVLSPATVGFVKVTQNAGTVSFSWETAGPVASTQINYGLDTNYGTSQTARLFGGGYKTWFYLDLSNLTSGATYHYQIATTDNQGNTVTTADATFTMP